MVGWPVDRSSNYLSDVDRVAPSDSMYYLAFENFHWHLASPAALASECPRSTV